MTARGVLLHRSVLLHRGVLGPAVACIAAEDPPAKTDHATRRDEERQAHAEPRDHPLA